MEITVESLEPDALYVFKLGPIFTDQGRTHAYVAVQGDGTSHLPVVASRDAAGLAELAHAFQGRRLYCEPRLARAGAVHGLISRPLPEELLPVRAVLALTLEWGLLTPELSLELIVQFLQATAALWWARPWQMGADVEELELRLGGAVRGQRELCLLGNGDEEVGFALYAQSGSVKRLGQLVKQDRMEEARRMDCLTLLFQEEPDWVCRAVRQAFDLPRFPVPVRLSKGEAIPMLQTDLLVLVAVASALAQLSPERLESQAKASLEGRHITARVRARVRTGSG